MIASMFIVLCPEGFLPEGYTPSEGNMVPTKKDYTWKEMLQTPIFYVMIVNMCCGAFMGMMIISQASPIAQQQVMMSASSAAVVVSVLGLFLSFVYRKMELNNESRNKTTR